LPSQWLSNPDLRHRLLNELVESTEPMWYLRVRLPAPRPAHSQPRNEALLRGYQELGKVAASEGRQVILATSGLTGWLATSLGAAGFGAGTTPATRTFAEPTVIPQQPESPWPRRPRYFEPALLHTVDFATHELLLRSKDYTPCGCTFCAELGAANPKPPPDQWNGELAGLHHLLQLGRLLARLHTTDPQSTARHQVEQARAFHASLPPFPTHHDNQPLHLKAWAQLLQ